MDTDWAGNPVTRKSTTCDVLEVLGFTFEVNVYGQTVLADSSGMAELIGICSAAKDGLGLQIMMKEFGLATQLRIRTDSSAARAMCHRLGHTSRTKHIEIRHLFIQNLVKEKKALVVKESTETNKADIGTKHFDAARLQYLRRRVGRAFEIGEIFDAEGHEINSLELSCGVQKHLYGLAGIGVGV